MTSDHYLIFQIDELFFAIPAQSVVRIIRAALPAVLPDGPDLLSGLLNVKGDMIPAINIRKQLSRSVRGLAITDRFIIVSVAEYNVAFACDQVHAVAELTLEPVEAAGAIYPELDQYITAASQYLRNTIFIYNIEKLIPPREVEKIHDYLLRNGQLS